MLPRAPHTLTEAQERILAGVAPVAGASSATSGLLLNAGFPYPTITRSDGRAVKLDQQTFAIVRQSPHQADRQAAMSAFFGGLGTFSQTLGSPLNGSVRASQFYAKARHYDSDLAARRDASNSLPSFHRYLRLRKRMMNVDALHYYDLYAPLVGSVDLSYAPEETQANIAAAVAPLGSDYVTTINRAFDGEVARRLWELAAQVLAPSS